MELDCDPLTATSSSLSSEFPREDPYIPELNQAANEHRCVYWLTNNRPHCYEAHAHCTVTVKGSQNIKIWTCLLFGKRISFAAIMWSEAIITEYVNAGKAPERDLRAIKGVCCCCCCFWIAVILWIRIICPWEYQGELDGGTVSALPGRKRLDWYFVLCHFFVSSLSLVTATSAILSEILFFFYPLKCVTLLLAPTGLTRIQHHALNAWTEEKLSFAFVAATVWLAVTTWTVWCLQSHLVCVTYYSPLTHHA